MPDIYIPAHDGTQEFEFLDQKYWDKNLKKMRMRTFLITKEFGKLESKSIDAVEDVNLSQRLFDSLADELLDSYAALLGA